MTNLRVDVFYLNTDQVTTMSESSNDSTMVDCVVQQAERLLAALSSLCTKENTDVCIECDEKKFFCHGVILKARSMYFYQMVEAGSQVIKVEGVRSEIMNDIINYIYTSQVIASLLKLLLDH